MTEKKKTGPKPMYGEPKTVQINFVVTPTCKSWIDSKPAGYVQAKLEAEARKAQKDHE